MELNTQGDSALSYMALKDQTVVLLQFHDYHFRRPEVILKLLLIQHCCVEQLIKVFLWAFECSKEFQFVLIADELLICTHSGLVHNAQFDTYFGLSLTKN